MTIKKSYLKEVLADIKKKAETEKQTMIVRARNIAFIEQSTGVSLCDDPWDLQHNGNVFKIDESDLKAIREVVGQFQDTPRKSLAYDFDTTNELFISVQPKKGSFSDMIFEYRRKLLDSDDCKVETIDHEGRAGYSTQQLVCPIS